MGELGEIGRLVGDDVLRDARVAGAGHLLQQLGRGEVVQLLAGARGADAGRRAAASGRAWWCRTWRRRPRRRSGAGREAGMRAAPGGRGRTPAGSHRAAGRRHGSGHRPSARSGTAGSSRRLGRRRSAAAPAKAARRDSVINGGGTPAPAEGRPGPAAAGRGRRGLRPPRRAAGGGSGEGGEARDEERRRRRHRDRRDPHRRWRRRCRSRRWCGRGTSRPSGWSTALSSRMVTSWMLPLASRPPPPRIVE